MGIADITCQSRETEVDVSSGHLHVQRFKAVVPSSLLVDLELQAQRLALDVPKLEHGPGVSSTEIHLPFAGQACQADRLRTIDSGHKTYGTSGQLVGLVVMVVIIRSLAVTQHGRSPGERIRMPRVGVSVEEQTQTGKVVYKQVDRYGQSDENVACTRSAAHRCCQTLDRAWLDQSSTTSRTHLRTSCALFRSPARMQRCISALLMH